MQYLRQIGVDVMQIMMQKAIILAIILLNLIASPLAVVADENQERRHRGPDRFEKIIALSGLNLTAEQMEKIMDLHKAYREESEPFREQLIGKGRELKELWLARIPDRRRIATLEDDIQELREQLRGKLETYRQEIRRFLTPQQCEELDAILQKHRRSPERKRHVRPRS